MDKLWWARQREKARRWTDKECWMSESNWVKSTLLMSWQKQEANAMRMKGYNGLSYYGGRHQNDNEINKEEGEEWTRLLALLLSSFHFRPAEIWISHPLPPNTSSEMRNCCPSLKVPLPRSSLPAFAHSGVQFRQAVCERYTPRIESIHHCSLFPPFAGTLGNFGTDWAQINLDNSDCVWTSPHSS